MPCHLQIHSDDSAVAGCISDGLHSTSGLGGTICFWMSIRQTSTSEGKGHNLDLSWDRTLVWWRRTNTRASTSITGWTWRPTQRMCLKKADEQALFGDLVSQLWVQCALLWLLGGQLWRGSHQQTKLTDQDQLAQNWEAVVESRSPEKLLLVMENPDHPRTIYWPGIEAPSLTDSFSSAATRTYRGNLSYHTLSSSIHNISVWLWGICQIIFIISIISISSSFHLP